MSAIFIFRKAKAYSGCSGKTEYLKQYLLKMILFQLLFRKAIITCSYINFIIKPMLETIRENYVLFRKSDSNIGT